MIPYEWLEKAENRIAPYIQHTPLTFDAARDLYIKWENRQVRGSFKARGAFNKVLQLEDWEREVSLVAASAGNHGQGVALAGREVGANVEIFVSEQAVPAKVAAMRALGATIHAIPGGYGEAESAGKNYAEEKQMTWVSPYNDGQIIAGQGTIGLEMLRKLSTETAVWLVPVGGGGLLSGIGSSLQKQAYHPRLIGVQAEASAFMHSLFYRGTQDDVPDLPSLADGLAGTVEQDSVTIAAVKQMADEIVLVSEDEIARAIAFAWDIYEEKLEGAGAVGLAAVLADKVKVRPAVVIVSGGNVQPDIHAEIVERFTVETWH